MRPFDVVVHPRAIALDPLAVARGHLVGERRDDDVARAPPSAPASVSSTFVARLVHEQRLRRALARRAAGR